MMDEIPRPEPAPLRSLRAKAGRFVLWCICAYLFLVVLTVMVGGAPFDVCWILLTGWIDFLTRTAPRIGWNWDLVGMGILCAALVLFLAHHFLSWAAKSAAASRGKTWRWPWKWTWSGAGAGVLFFLIGMATGGTVHQVGWIAGSPEPWFEEKGGARDYINMTQLDLAFRVVADDATNHVAAVRRDILNPDPETLIVPRSRNEPPMTQTYHLLLIVDPPDKVAGWIIFPRDPQRFARAGGYCYFDQTNNYLRSDQLLEFIRRHQAHLVAL